MSVWTRSLCWASLSGPSSSLRANLRSYLQASWSTFLCCELTALALRRSDPSSHPLESWDTHTEFFIMQNIWGHLSRAFLSHEALPGFRSCYCLMKHIELLDASNVLSLAAESVNGAMDDICMITRMWELIHQQRGVSSISSFSASLRLISSQPFPYTTTTTLIASHSRSWTFTIIIYLSAFARGRS